MEKTKSLFQRTTHNLSLVRYYPEDLETRFELVICKIHRDHKQSIVIEL